MLILPLYHQVHLLLHSHVLHTQYLCLKQLQIQIGLSRVLLSLTRTHILVHSIGIVSGMNPGTPVFKVGVEYPIAFLQLTCDQFILLGQQLLNRPLHPCLHPILLNNFSHMSRNVLLE